MSKPPFTQAQFVQEVNGRLALRDDYSGPDVVLQMDAPMSFDWDGPYEQRGLLAQVCREILAEFEFEQLSIPKER